MIETTSGLTLIYARAIGGFLAAIGLVGVISPPRFKAMVAEFETSPGLALLAGLAALALGSAILATHPWWDDALSVIVSLVGWASLVKGFALILAPRPWMGLAEAAFRKAETARLLAIAILLIGVALAAAGFTAQAKYAA